MLPSKLKLDEEKSIYDSLAHQNGFGPTFLYNLGKLVKGTTKLKNSSSWSAVFFQDFLFVAKSAHGSSEDVEKMVIIPKKI